MLIHKAEFLYAYYQKTSQQLRKWVFEEGLPISPTIRNTDPCLRQL